MQPDDRIQSWLIDIPELLLPLAKPLEDESEVARADSPLLGRSYGPFNTMSFDMIPMEEHIHVRELSVDKPLPPCPARTPSPSTPTLTLADSSLDSSPDSDQRCLYLLSASPEPAYSRRSSANSAIFTGPRSQSMSVSAGHEPLSRNSSGSSKPSPRPSYHVFAPPSTPLTRRTSRRSPSPRLLNNGLSDDQETISRRLTTMSSFDNLKNANRASARNAVYIDSEEVERKLGELALLQQEHRLHPSLPGTPHSIPSLIPEDEPTDFQLALASTSTIPVILDSVPPAPRPSRNSSRPGSANTGTIKRNRNRQDSFTPEFIFPVSSPTVLLSPSLSPESTSSTSTPTPTSNSPLPTLISHEPSVEEQLKSQFEVDTPSKKRQSRRQRLVSFISRITTSTALPSSPYSGAFDHTARDDSTVLVSIPSSPSSAAFQHFSTPSSSSTSSYDYLNSTLASSLASIPPEKLDVGVDSTDPFAKVPISILPTPEITSPISPVHLSPPRRRLRAVSFTGGVKTKASPGLQPPVPTLNRAVVDLNISPAPSPMTSYFSPSATHLPDVASEPISTSRFSHKLLMGRFSKVPSPTSPPSTPKKPLHKRLSLNPLLLPRGAASSAIPSSPPLSTELMQNITPQKF
ncbi:hypothetical protein C8J56DRAFT_536900 [Mycena floridula]|nr:hypothetical protein C8J56DRAFT_536900 [Mycena floridula]